MFSWIIMMPHERWNIRNEKASLGARHLVMVKLHRVDAAAAELIILRVRSENGGQKNAGTCALWVKTHGIKFLLWLDLTSGSGDFARNITVIPPD